MKLDLRNPRECILSKKENGTNSGMPDDQKMCLVMSPNFACVCLLAFGRKVR